MTNQAVSDSSKKRDAGADGKPERGQDAGTLIAALQRHRARPRTEPGYWDTYCALICALCRATAVVLVQRGPEGWGVIGRECEADDWSLHHWQQALDDLGGRALQNGYAFSPMQDNARRLRILAVVRTSGIGEALLVIDIPERERGQLNDVVMRAMLASDFSESASHDAPPGSSARALPAVVPASAGDDRHVEAGQALLELAGQVMHERRFGAATLLLVNGIAAHFGADQVQLGWVQEGEARTVAVSHLDRFERNTHNIRVVEEVFLEALGEEGPVWYTPESGDGLLIAHARLCELHGFARLHAVPISDTAGTRRAMLLLAYRERRPAAPAIDELLLAMGMLQPWLADLRRRDRAWYLRSVDAFKERAARLIGPGKVWGRVTAVLLSALILFAAFGTWDYRIEAMSQLTTDSTRLVSAQFDGRVDEVKASAGDVVRAGDVLITLDTRELAQQERDIRADQQRLRAEADKARAVGNLADLEIAAARIAQSEARLARVLDYLSQAKAVAPFDGVVVDGERKDLLNAPVKKGDKLLRVARIDGLYVEMLVPEREIRYVKPNATGELRLLSRPDQTIPFQLSTFIPMAQVKGQEGNHFLIKAELKQAPEAWWRPGMSGIVQIDGGRQNVAWILTHKLVDTLRMKLWWLW